MNLPGWVQNVAAIAIVAGAAAWLLRRAIWKKSAPQGCENCPAHRPKQASRSERA